MLYNILPPTIFFLSLGGVMIIVSRAMIRMRREAFVTSVKSYEDNIPTTGTADVLRPAQKSVHVITSRVALLLSLIKQLPKAATSSASSAAAGINNFRQARAAAKQLRKNNEIAKPLETDDVLSSTASVIEPKKKLGQRLLQVKEWAEQQAAKQAAQVKERATAVQKALPRRQQTKSLQTEEADVEQPESLRSRFKLPRVRRQGSEEAITAAAATIQRIRTRVVNSAVPAMEEKATVPAPASEDVITTAQATSVAQKLLGRRQAPVPSPLASAQAALAAKQYQQAEDILVSYIVKNTKDTAAYMVLGQVAIERGAWDEAMEIFSQVISWDPQCKNAFASLGLAACRAGRFTRAIEALQRAHEADPSDASVLMELLSIAQKMDNRPMQHSISRKLAELGIEQAEPVRERV